MQRLFSGVLLVALFVADAAGVSANPADPTIRFGLMKKDSTGRYYVYKETREVPLVLSDPTFRFGFEIEHAASGNFTGYAVLHFPSADQQVRGTLGRSESAMLRRPDFAGRSFRTDKVTYQKWWGVDFGLDNEKDLGDYRLEIFIDDALVKSLDFSVKQP